MIGRQQQGNRDNRFQQWVNLSLNSLVVLGRTVLKESWLKGDDLERVFPPLPMAVVYQKLLACFCRRRRLPLQWKSRPAEVSEQQRATPDSEMLINEGQEKSCWLGDKQKNDLLLKVNKVLDQNLLLHGPTQSHDLTVGFPSISPG